MTLRTLFTPIAMDLRLTRSMWTLILGTLFFVTQTGGYDDNECPYCFDNCQQYFKDGPFSECVQAHFTECCKKAKKEKEKKEEEEENQKILKIVGFTILGVVLFGVCVGLIICSFMYYVANRRRQQIRGVGVIGAQPQPYTSSSTNAGNFNTYQPQPAPYSNPDSFGGAYNA